MQLLEENMQRTLYDINCNKIFFNPPARIMKIKRKISKWDLVNLYAFA